MAKEQPTYDGFTDAQIMERACDTPGCVNMRCRGYIICEACNWGQPDKLPPEAAKRKRKLDKGRK